jgi:ADP-ribosyl-[dinitrogen reductase] hydrolase
MWSSLKTSSNSPLGIAEVAVHPAPGLLGLTLCPGKKDPPRNWDRDLQLDLLRIRDWGASTIVTLIEAHEFRLLQVEALGEEVVRHGMDWLHLPIRDVDVPDARFERAWEAAGPALHGRIDAGERVLIHCRGGLGRSGLVAALILVERGWEPRAAIRRIREARPNAIETPEQEDYVVRAAGKQPPGNARPD